MNSKAQIIIAESESIIAADIDLQIRSWGHSESMIARTKDQAIHIIEKWHPDLVIFDANLKGCGNGIDVVSQIYNQYNSAIIFLVDCLNSELEHYQTCNKSFYVIEKPFDKNELRLVVEIALLNKMKSLNKKRFQMTNRNIFQFISRPKQYAESVSP